MTSPDGRLCKGKFLLPPEIHLLQELYKEQLIETRGAIRLAARKRFQLFPDQGVGLTVSALLLDLPPGIIADPTTIDAETWRELEEARIKDNNVRNWTRHQNEIAALPAGRRVARNGL